MRYHLGLGLFSSLMLLLGMPACGDDTGTGGTTTGDSTTTGADGGDGGGTSTTTTGAGGNGGDAATTTTGAGGSVAADHLLISEIAVAPEGGVFVEIWNPTAAAVALDDYYLSDNSTYVALASGGAWEPITNNPGTDFLARFPAGASIAADAVIVIAFDTGYEKAYKACPDFYMGTAELDCGIASTPAMLETETGSVTDESGLSNAREMLILFTWDGNTASLLRDVDYVTWGPTFEAGTRVDKTGVAGYQPDTAPDAQSPAPAPLIAESIERCGLETGETLDGGNGIDGHDETSEDMSVTFVPQAAPTPGVKNACL